jgi:crotonobetainyl-CoA:carnitine CoA-transferase CaiB-like acyl-CoA transferase
VDELNSIVAEWIVSQPVDELCQVLDDAKLAYSFIFSIADIMKDPHYAARGSIATVDQPRIGPVRMAGVFPKFSGGANKEISPAPDLGQHTAEIYGGLLGLSPERLAELSAAGVI